MATTHSATGKPEFSTLDVLWAFYQSQPLRVRRAFRARLEAQEKMETSRPKVNPRKKRAAALTKTSEQDRLKKDLESFSAYKENWDGEGGLPLTEKVIHNFETLLSQMSARSLQHIDIYPENNGSLLIMSRTQEAGVNIGDETYTYYVTHGEQVEGESHLAFMVEDVLDKIEIIAQ